MLAVGWHPSWGCGPDTRTRPLPVARASSWLGPLAPGSSPRARAGQKWQPFLRPRLEVTEPHLHCSLASAGSSGEPAQVQGEGERLHLLGRAARWPFLQSATSSNPPSLHPLSLCGIHPSFCGIRVWRACLNGAVASSAGHHGNTSCSRDFLWAPSSLPCPHHQASRPWPLLPCPLSLLTQWHWTCGCLSPTAAEPALWPPVETVLLGASLGGPWDGNGVTRWGRSLSEAQPP